MKSFEYFDEVLWNPSFWLPPNTTWEDFQQRESSDGYRIPQIYDLLTALKLVPLLLLVRYTCERYILAKIAVWGGIEKKRWKKPPSCDLLEQAYCSNPKKKWENQELMVFSKRLDWSEKQVEEWLRARKRVGKSTTFEKFCESSWRSVFFTCAFTYGLYAHWTKEWFWDFKLFWKDFPQPVTEDLYWYFIVSVANYSSWSISHFWDVQRKDPGIMLFHHFITLTLLSMQWIARFHRLGLVVCLLHDAGDLFLELSKCVKYLKLTVTCMVMGLLFTAVWIITRVIILPFYVIPSGYIYAPQRISQGFPFSCIHGPCDISSFRLTTSHVLLFALCSLVLLHVYWTWCICKVIYMAVFLGKLEDDAVSGSEDEEEDQKK